MSELDQTINQLETEPMDLPELTDAAQVKELLGGKTHAPNFALIYIELCIAILKTDPNTVVANLKGVTKLPGSHWECSWGPATDATGANLVMVATAVSDRTNAPLLHVVVIRGTDISWQIMRGDFKQLAEDLKVWEQVGLSWLPPAARIAQGTSEGLATIMALRSPKITPNRTLLEFLASTQTGPAQSRPGIVVTGHSLGGCLTAVVAPWLAWALPDSMVLATSFAGPSAGNQEFVDFVAKSVPVFHRYFNTLDVVPNWWADLKENNIIYRSNGLYIPDMMFVMDEVLNYFDPKYAQPATGRPINGVFQRNQNWIGEAEFQHHATTYRSLIRIASIS